MYDNECYLRDESVAGLQGWLWIKSDHGAWEGPKTDWEDHHQHKWFTHVKDYSICVQAGGCHGVYPRLLSDIFQRVFTFEPDPLNFHCLVNNCQKDNIIKINAALGASHGLVKMHRTSMENVGMHKVVSGADVPTFLIDDLDLPSCGLIALDLEGYEIHALNGARQTIEKYHPVITCEVPSLDVRAYLKEFGYQEIHRSVADVVFAVA